MAVNKVIYDGNTLIDLTGDSVTPETLMTGITAHNRAGKAISGRLQAVKLTVDSNGNGTLTGAGMSVDSAGNATAG